MHHLTQRLFDTDSHLFTFAATVLACEPGEGNTLLVILDATAFFPEGGGQYADPGTLGGCPVLDVRETGGVIVHTVKLEKAAPEETLSEDIAGTDVRPEDTAVEAAAVFTPGATVEGRLDAATRMVRMQNHSAEHILSGIIHRRYGLSNVGFHLGDGDVTLDFDGVLTRAQLDEVEDEANAVIRACLPIRASYPAPDELATLSYRAKLDLTENVRIVEIGDGDAPVDRCACCAPHVSNTGEIGLVKMLDVRHYKGGIRIHMLAGAWALADYRRRYTDTATIAAALSVKQEEVAAGFDRLLAEIEDRKRSVSALRAKVQELTVAAIPVTDGSVCYFEEDLDANEMRHLLNRLKQKCGRLCGVFVGNDASGYRFVIGRGDASVDLKLHAKDMSTALLASGGGSSEMQQGRSQATRAVIEAYFENF